MSEEESAKGKNPASQRSDGFIHPKPLSAQIFGHTSQLRSPLAANKAFNIPKLNRPRPEHHRAKEDGLRYSSGSDGDGFRDPVELMNRQLLSQGTAIPIRLPTVPKTKPLYKAPPVKYSSLHTPFSQPSDDGGFKKQLQNLGMLQVDAALFEDKYGIYENLPPVDPAKAAKDVKALLEGAFDDNDGEPKRKSRKKPATSVNEVTNQLQTTTIGGEAKAEEKATEELNTSAVEEEDEKEVAADDGTRPGLKVKLLPHQIRGVNWMIRQEIGTESKEAVIKGGILADDMGLGKTIQTISLLLLNPRPKLKDSKLPRDVARSTLVVAPLALIKQWERELNDRVEDSHYMKVLVHHGPKRTKSGEELRKYDVVITTYQTITSEHEASSDRKDGPKVGCLDVHWYRVILDEAHTIKNRNAKCTKGCYDLRAEYRWCLTGTPMQNHLDELHSLITFLRVSSFSQKNVWKQKIVDPMNKGNAELAVQRLQAVLKSIMKRRTKDVLRDQAGFGTGEANTEGFKLVGRKVEIVTVQFSTRERDFYKRLEEKADMNIEKMMSSDKMNYAGTMALLLRLRQACNHKELIKKSLGQDVDALEVIGGSMPSKSPNKQSQSSSQDIDSLASLLGGLEVNAKTCELCGDELSAEELSSKMARCVDCNAFVEEDEEEQHAPTASKSSQKKHSSRKADATSGTSRRQFNRPIIEDSSDEESGDWIVPESQRAAAYLGKAGGQEDEDAEGGGEWLSPNDSDTDDDSKQISSISNTNYDPLENNLATQYEEDDSFLGLSQGLKLGISTKIQTMIGILHKEVSQHKFIIFSEWTSMLNLLEPFLRAEDIRYCRYDGKMKNDDREASLARLRNDSETRVLLCSLKCGSLGLNLTAASRVIIMEPFWNPFVEEQAIDRVHRLNQTVDVVVYRLTIQATVEEQIFNLQNKKRELAAAALEGKAIAKLTMNELLNLFKHDAEHYVKGTALGDFMLGVAESNREFTNAANNMSRHGGMSQSRTKQQTKASSRPEHAIYGRRW